METIISALISSSITLLICIFNNHTQANKTRAIMEYKLEELIKKVEKHNTLIERTYKLEQDVHLQEEKIKVINHRIEDLEKT